MIAWPKLFFTAGYSMATCGRAPSPQTLKLRGFDLTDDSTEASKIHSKGLISFGEKVTDAKTWPCGGIRAFCGSMSKMSWIFDDDLLLTAVILGLYWTLYAIYQQNTEIRRLCEILSNTLLGYSFVFSKISLPVVYFFKNNNCLTTIIGEL